jgi:hypothetical protein
MSKVTELGTGQITAVHSLTVELVDADETPAVVIVQWPTQSTVLHTHAASLRSLLPLRDCSPPLALNWPASRPGGGCDHQPASRVLRGLPLDHDHQFSGVAHGLSTIDRLSIATHEK